MNSSVEKFHANCLASWQTYNCLVCYYVKNPDLIKNCTCMKCDAVGTKWFCLTCAHVGCGQEVQSHALEHYTKTTHRYAMEIHNFRVWDYKRKINLHIFNNKKQQELLSLQDCGAEVKTTGCKCPVCRYFNTPKLIKQPVCMGCGDDRISILYICLFCSYIGCSREYNRHALEHNANTKHPYTMQLENFSIWDYKEEKWLHRQLNEPLIEKEIVKHDSEHLKEYFDRRMYRLEHEWLQFTEANNKIVNIEERLLILEQENKQLEEKLCEHESKGASVTHNSVANSCHMRMIKSEQVEKINKTGNHQDIESAIESNKNLYVKNQVLNPAKVCEKCHETNFFSLIVSGLFIYHSLMLILQRLGQIIFNLL